MLFGRIMPLSGIIATLGKAVLDQVELSTDFLARGCALAYAFLMFAVLTCV